MTETSNQTVLRQHVSQNTQMALGLQSQLATSIQTLQMLPGGCPAEVAALTQAKTGIDAVVPTLQNLNNALTDSNNVG